MTVSTRRTTTIEDISGKLPTELMQVTDPQEDIDDVLSREFHVDYPIVNMLPELNMVRQTDKGGSAQPSREQRSHRTVP